jgi:hypothetical protein
VKPEWCTPRRRSRLAALFAATMAISLQWTRRLN